MASIGTRARALCAGALGACREQRGGWRRTSRPRYDLDVAAGPGPSRDARFGSGLSRLLGAAACLLALASGTEAEEPPVDGLVQTARFAPRSRAAELAIERLSRQGPPGWKALAALCCDEEPAAARAAARALAGCEEPRSRALAWKAYSRAGDESVRAELAQGLARAYPEHEEALLERIEDDLPRASELLAELARRGLPSARVLPFLAVEGVAEAAYEVLRARGEPPAADAITVAARVVARRSLAPVACRAYAARFAADPDFHLLGAVAECLAPEEDEAVRTGAHCLLSVVSGLEKRADRELWRPWIAAPRERYTPPPSFNRGAVAAAVARAVRFLLRDLREDGLAVWPGHQAGHTHVGSTSLAILALRAAGVPPDDPGIQKAIETTLLKYDGAARAHRPRFGHGGITYCLSLQAMALQATDPELYKTALQGIADRLAAGQLANGQWTYRCPKRAAAGAPNRPATGDNSNTQFALLGLRAARLGAAAVPRQTWERALRFWSTTTNPAGGWNYAPVVDQVDDRQASMTAAGVGSVAICHEALAGQAARARIREDEVAQRALRYLAAMLARQGLGGVELYGWYALERACALTGTWRFVVGDEAFDWHERGALRLVHTQSASGAWGHPTSAGAVGQGYGALVDTCFALLFLGRATAPVDRRSKPEDLQIELGEGERMAARPSFAQPPGPPPAAPAGRCLVRLDATVLATSDGTAVIRGRLLEPGARLTVDGGQVVPDEESRFAAPVTVERTRRIEVVATAADGTQESAVVRVELDTQAPTLRLVGDTRRHVGKQALYLEADELLDYVRIGSRVFPSEGRRVQAFADVREGKHPVHVKVLDLAGNLSKHAFDLEARNLVLQGDGRSLLWTPMPSKPEEFTLECWARGSEPRTDQCLTSFTWGWAGAGIYWHAVGEPLFPRTPRPHAVIHLDGEYKALPAQRDWDWGKWTHLALCYDGQTARFFVNGRLQAECRSERYRSNPDHFHAGGSPGPQWFFLGEIDELRFSSTSRYAAKFKPERVHYRDSQTVLLLHFDLDTESTFVDDSDKPHRLIPHGTPRVTAARR